MERSFPEGTQDSVPWTYDREADRLAAATVLVVEDDPDIRAMLGTLLELAGFRCFACDSAEAGLAALRQNTFDLVLTDYSLPERTGLWLLETAQSEGLLEGVPALIVTAHPSVEDAGRYEIVQKPFDLDDLVERVRMHMENGGPKRRRGATPPSTDGDAGGSGGDGKEPVELILYVSAHSPHSAAAVRTIKTVLSRLNTSRVRLTVRDLTADPSSGAEDSIAFTPTLVRRKPAPRTFIVGHMTNPDLLMELLADCTLDDN